MPKDHAKSLQLQVALELVMPSSKQSHPATAAEKTKRTFGINIPIKTKRSADGSAADDDKEQPTCARPPTLEQLAGIAWDGKGIGGNINNNNHVTDHDASATEQATAPNAKSKHEKKSGDNAKKEKKKEKKKRKSSKKEQRRSSDLLDTQTTTATTATATARDDDDASSTRAKQATAHQHQHNQGVNAKQGKKSDDDAMKKQRRSFDLLRTLTTTPTARSDDDNRRDVPAPRRASQRMSTGAVEAASSSDSTGHLPPSAEARGVEATAASSPLRRPRRGWSLQRQRRREPSMSLEDLQLMESELRLQQRPSSSQPHLSQQPQLSSHHQLKEHQQQQPQPSSSNPRRYSNDQCRKSHHDMAPELFNNSDTLLATPSGEGLPVDLHSSEPKLLRKQVRLRTSKLTASKHVINQAQQRLFRRSKSVEETMRSKSVEDTMKCDRADSPMPSWSAAPPLSSAPPPGESKQAKTYSERSPSQEGRCTETRRQSGGFANTTTPASIERADSPMPATATPLFGALFGDSSIRPNLRATLEASQANHPLHPQMSNNFMNVHPYPAACSSGRRGSSPHPLPGRQREQQRQVQSPAEDTGKRESSHQNTSSGEQPETSKCWDWDNEASSDLNSVKQKNGINNGHSHTSRGHSDKTNSSDPSQGKKTFINNPPEEAGEGEQETATAVDPPEGGGGQEERLAGALASSFLASSSSNNTSQQDASSGNGLGFLHDMSSFHNEDRTTPPLNHSMNSDASIRTVDDLDNADSSSLDQVTEAADATRESHPTAEQLHHLIEMMQVEFQKLRGAKVNAEMRAQQLETDLVAMQQERDAEFMTLTEENEQWKRTVLEERVRHEHEVDTMRALEGENANAARRENVLEEKVKRLESENQSLKRLMQQQHGSRYAQCRKGTAVEANRSRDAMALEDNSSHSLPSSFFSGSVTAAPMSKVDSLPSQHDRYRTPDPPPSPSWYSSPPQTRPLEPMPMNTAADRNASFRRPSHNLPRHGSPQHTLLRRQAREATRQATEGRPLQAQSRLHRKKYARDPPGPSLNHSVPQAPASWHAGKSTESSASVRRMTASIVPPLTTGRSGTETNPDSALTPPAPRYIHSRRGSKYPRRKSSTSSTASTVRSSVASMLQNSSQQEDGEFESSSRSLRDSSLREEEELGSSFQSMDIGMVVSMEHRNNYYIATKEGDDGGGVDDSTRSGPL